MNVGDVEQNVDKLVADGFAEKKGDKTVVNLSNMGIDKLLGFGNVNKKYEIVVADSSERAKQKVESAGGAIVEPQ
jgi:large subunit ribosomal protein L15